MEADVKSEKAKLGRIVILSGPSGVGKSTVRDAVMRQTPIPLKLSVSATTRQPRAGEVDGVAYYFLSDEEFASRRANGEFLECKEVFGRNIWYGTLRSEVEHHLQRGDWVMLEIDVDGASDVVAQCPDAITVFVEPKSLDVLEQRLRSRGTETDEVIRHRLARAQYEIEKSKFYKYHIVNDRLEDAVRDFCGILEKEAGEDHD